MQPKSAKSATKICKSAKICKPYSATLKPNCRHFAVILYELSYLNYLNISGLVLIEFLFLPNLPAILLNLVAILPNLAFYLQ